MEEKSEKPKIKYQVDYRNVKYPRLEFKTGNLLLILPKDYKDETRILEKHKEWIHKKEQTIKKALEEAKERSLNLTRTDKELKTMTHSIIKRYQEEYNFKINKIFFRRMKTKWASYSSKGNLTINTLLKYIPNKLVEYVIYHEMAHSQERKHNERFWKIINKKFKEYHEYEEKLLIYWFLIQKRVIKNSY